MKWFIKYLLLFSTVSKKRWWPQSRRTDDSAT